ncbi:MAG: 2Fe-2S iron-sulfur cluster-binding protein [Candidatus Thermoplasmatota archaeon]|nr:2Fe-2S iron-sulfur cluster-binding protein [Candidatus Thermoplasmatota archaeon]
MRTITLEIDEKKVKAEEGMTILQAAKSVGIDIPTLCYHEKLEPYGACRLCMVEITKNKRSRLVTSCCYPVEEGLIVKTDTEKVNKIRKTIIELLLPLAPTGPIMTLGAKYGLCEYIKKTEVEGEWKVKGFRFPTEQNDCTLCGLCVRYCAEIKKENAVGFIGRGVDRHIAILPEKGGICIFCRECYNLCDGGKFPHEAEAF